MNNMDIAAVLAKRRPQLALKRLMDVAISGCALLVLWPLLLLLSAYLACDLVFAVRGALSQESGRLLALLTLPFLFPAVHVVYGVGTLAGLLSGKE